MRFMVLSMQGNHCMQGFPCRADAHCALSSLQLKPRQIYCLRNGIRVEFNSDFFLQF